MSSFFFVRVKDRAFLQLAAAMWLLKTQFPQMVLDVKSVCFTEITDVLRFIHIYVLSDTKITPEETSPLANAQQMLLLATLIAWMCSNG